MTQAETDKRATERATEEPVLIALTAGICMCGPMGRRMFASGRPIWGTRDGATEKQS